MNQQDNSLKNEINFWNGKVSTLKRDLEFQQTFSENMQLENRKLLADVENLSRVLEMKEKDLKLVKKQVDGLQEDNERISKMYQLVQKEAFQGVDKLKKMHGGMGPVSSGAE